MCMLEPCRVPIKQHAGVTSCSSKSLNPRSWCAGEDLPERINKLAQLAKASARASRNAV